jgi:hypothetical protein
LGLTDRDVYLHCDINKAYDQLLTAGIDEGYSTALLDARQDLLDLVKERAIRQEGRIEGTRRQLAIPVSLLPSALVLLAQVGRAAVGGYALPQAGPLGQLTVGGATHSDSLLHSLGASC